MSIIKVTPEMLAKFDVLPKNWYPFEVYGTEEKASKKSGTLEVRVFCKVVEGDKKGTQVMMRFYPNAMGEPFINFTGAIENCEITEGMEINPSAWVGKQVWGEADENTYEGRIVNEFREFRHISDTPAF